MLKAQTNAPAADNPNLDFISFSSPWSHLLVERRSSFRSLSERKEMLV
jgi:hypothetical protein